MSLSEDLSKYDTNVEGIVKKFEKTFIELYTSDYQEQQQQLQQQQKAAASGSTQRQSLLPSSTTSSSTSSTSSASPSSQLLIDDTTTPVDYIKKFKWNDIRFNKRSPLPQLVDIIIKECIRTDDDLKEKLTEYNDIKQQVTAIERAEYGTLVTRSLGQYIKASDVIDTENLTTLYVIVPKNRQQEFESQYETWMLDPATIQQKSANVKKTTPAASTSGEDKDHTSEVKRDETTTTPAAAASDTSKAQSASQQQSQHQFAVDSKPLPSHLRPIVPRSSKMLYGGSNEAGDDMLLYRVVVFKKGADQYKLILRDKRLNIRTYQYATAVAEEQQQRERYSELLKKKKSLWNHLFRYTKTMYSELYVNWIHLKAIRVYVESVLRYGLPPDFKCILIEPVRGKEKQLRNALNKLYSRLGGQHSMLQQKGGSVDESLSAFGDTDEFYPYVQITIRLGD
jgi:hypothetical protein